MHAIARTASGTVVAALLLLPAPALAQHDTSLAAGEQYRKPALYRLFFGSEYRQLWTVPVRAPVLDLATFGGGLTPTTAGGGFQTKSLRFRGADGYQYGFRSVDKDPALLPPELDGTFLDDIVKDKTSAQHPGAPAVVAALLETAGVLHGEPILVVLPDDARLDSFRTRFAGTLGFIERRAIVEPGRPGFAGASEIITSPAMLRRVFRSPAERVDERAFLRARLMDLVFGDWDRHRDQWRWARIGEGPVRWRPIPEDRDHAFVRFDGLLPSVARNTSEPMLLNFGEAYSDLAGQVWNGRDLDRSLLGALEWPAWDSVARDLQSRLTDSAITAAVGRLPEEWRALDGDRLAQALRERRDELPEQAQRFYRWLAREAEVHATAAAEQVTVERLDGGRLAVAVAEPGATPWFSRTFVPGETREVRLFLARQRNPRDTVDLRLYHDGAPDRVVVRGTGPADITLRIIKDEGTQVTDSAPGGVREYAAVFEPPPADVGDRPPAPAIPSDGLERPPDRDWGARTVPEMRIGAGPDIGLFVALGATRTGYAFRKSPWASRWTMRAGWATSAAHGRVVVDGAVRREASRVRTQVHLLASGIEALRWHGIGNATVAQSGRYNYVSRAELGATIALVMPVGRHMEMGLGPTVVYAHTREEPGRIIADSLPYGSGKFGLAGLRAGLTWDTRDRSTAATRGLSFVLGGSAFPAVWSADSAFGEVHAHASAYLTAARVPLRPTLALRAGGQAVIGHYPYGEAAFIGGPATVRLGRVNRYGGDQAAWAGSELRLALTHFRVLLPGELGVFGLAETGRVWVEGETSEQWHAAVGGGVWFSVVQPQNVFSISVASSAERTALYFLAGFAY